MNQNVVAFGGPPGVFVFQRIEVEPEASNVRVENCSKEAAATTGGTSQDGAQYEEVRGFGVRITAAGTVAFIFNYRTRSGRQRRLKIGRHPAYSALHKRPAHDF